MRYPPPYATVGDVRRDMDAPYVLDLPSAPSRLVIVLGLHRSGTTYLHQLIAEHFALATLQLHHVVHYRQLLHSRHTGSEDALYRELSAYLARLSIDDRAIDGVRVHPACLEEYCFVLRRHAGTWSYRRSSANVFDEMIRKLAVLQPGTSGVLLKNPYDLPNIDALHARYPSARFVVIRRDPLRNLDSFFRAMLLHGEGPEPYLRLLTEGAPDVQRFFAMIPPLARLLGAGYRPFIASVLRRRMVSETARYVAARRRVAAKALLEVEYEELMRDPGLAVARIAEHIGLAPRGDAQPPRRTPRTIALAPEVAASAAFLHANLPASLWQNVPTTAPDDEPHLIRR